MRKLADWHICIEEIVKDWNNQIIADTVKPRDRERTIHTPLGVRI